MTRHTRPASIAVGLIAAIAIGACRRTSAIPNRQWDYGVLRPHEVRVYHFGYRADARAHVWVRASRVTRLRCDVFDQRGTLIDSDTSAIDECLLRWIPRYTGTFTVAVHNRGDRPDEYYLETK